MAKTALGTYIQNTRKKRGLTQAQVAEKIPVDVEPDTIGKIEQGEIENPSMPVLRGIASVLGISLSSLTSKLPAGAKPAPKFAPFGEGKEMTVSSDFSEIGYVQTTVPGVNVTPLLTESETLIKELEELDATKMVGMATDFDELDEEEERMQGVKMAYKMAQMVLNIAHNPEISDKAAAVSRLAQQYSRRINPASDKSADEIVDQVKHFAEEVEWDNHWEKAVWSTSYVNDLPDANFLFIAPGGTKDGEGKTTPRRLRYFPYKDKEGGIDLPHLRNAIARIPQAKHPALTSEKKSALQEKARKLLSDQSEGKEKVDTTFRVLKQRDGSYRWLSIYSNNFRDQDNPPEIISAKSHERFVELVDKGDVPMPELWLWHVKGTRWGVADMVAYDDRGFALATGPVDKGKEHIADALAKEAEIGVSHGMPSGSILRDETDSSVIIEHITREISPLPRSAAANKLTGFEVLTEAKEMAIPQEKAEFLIRVGENPDAIDGALKNLADEAEAQQLEAKEQADPVEEPQPDPTPEPEPAAATEGVSREEVVELATGIAEAIKAQGDQIETLIKEMVALKAGQTEALSRQMEQMPAASLAAMFHEKAFGQYGEDAVHPSTTKKEGPVETDSNKEQEGPTLVPFLNRFITNADQRQ